MFPKIKLLVIILAFSLGGGFFLILKTLGDGNHVLIESEESKNQELNSVFNKIKWISTPSRDIWMMNQSHHGLKATEEKWERLAIIIDKKKMTARFYQISPGPLEWDDDLVNKRVPYRASCFTCHSNGPRAIRPNLHNPEVKNKLGERVKIFFWNLRIKTYGRIHYDESHNHEDLKLSVPFHYAAKNENDQLKVRTCIQCHNETSVLGRGFLVRQQAGTIERMVENSHMPPMGFSMSNDEKKKLKDFLRGF